MVSIVKIFFLVSSIVLLFYIGSLELLPYPFSKTPIGFSIGTASGVLFFGVFFMWDSRPIFSVIFLFLLMGLVQRWFDIDLYEAEALSYKRIELILGSLSGIAWLYWFRWEKHSMNTEHKELKV